MISKQKDVFFKGVQNVVLTTDGVLVDSDNAIIDLSNLEGVCIYEAQPVTESAIEGMKDTGKKELYLPRVEMSINHKTYIFDFYFKLIGPKDDHSYLWIIQDLSKVYHYLSKVQQERNEALVKYERLQKKIQDKD